MAEVRFIYQRNDAGAPLAWVEIIIDDNDSPIALRVVEADASHTETLPVGYTMEQAQKLAEERAAKCARYSEENTPTDEVSARDLADILDAKGDWSWSDGSEHEPSDRLGILEHAGAWYVVYRGTEPDEATAHATEAGARTALTKQIAELEDSAAAMCEEED